MFMSFQSDCSAIAFRPGNLREPLTGGRQQTPTAARKAPAGLDPGWTVQEQAISLTIPVRWYGSGPIPRQPFLEQRTMSGNRPRNNFAETGSLV
jgi:hypothetical protein